MTRKKSSGESERLRALIKEATVDCYDFEEQHQGLLNMIEENVICPFPARVLGEPVEVTALEFTDTGSNVKAVCRHKGKDYRIDISSLEFGKQRPEGFEWIEAYLEWQKTAG
jgi:hypothetical protein